MKLLLRPTAGSSLNQVPGFEAGQEAFHLGLHLPCFILKSSLEFSEDGLHGSLAVDQVPDGCGRTLQHDGLACVQMEQGNPVGAFGLDLRDEGGVTAHDIHGYNFTRVMADPGVSCLVVPRSWNVMTVVTAYVAPSCFLPL